MNVPLDQILLSARQSLAKAQAVKYAIHHADFRTTAWAVYLGADTVPRLAREWNVTSYAARGRLKQAASNGYLIVCGMRDGWHPSVRYAPVPELVAEWL